jgi:hypothetical protein
MHRGAVTVDVAAHELGIADVHWLIECSTASGADPARIQAVANALVDALLDLQAFRNGDHDPRRQRSLALARRILRARDAGADMGTLREEFGKSKPQINKLLRLATSRAACVLKLHL